MAISARATAARSNAAGFWIGSRLATLDQGLPNALLSVLTGSHVALSVMDYQALASAQVDVLRFADALRTELDMEAATFADTLDGTILLPQALRAMAAATDSPAARALLIAMAGGTPNMPIDLARLIDLGPMGTLDLAAEETSLLVDALRMLTVIAQTAGGARQLQLNLAAGVPGLAATRVDLAIGERPQHSPWLTVTDRRDVVLRTAQTRVRVETQIAGTAPLAALRLPLFIELASAEARLDAITCTGGEAGRSVDLSVTPSVGRIAIAESDPATFANFAQPVALSPAALLSLPLIQVRAFADVQLGGANAQIVRFTDADIAAYRVKTVKTDDIATASIGSLVGRTQLSVNALALPVSAGAVGTLLQDAAPNIDGLLSPLLDLLGVGLGEADVGVSRMRCGIPMLVG